MKTHYRIFLLLSLIIVSYLSGEDVILHDTFSSLTLNESLDGMKPEKGDGTWNLFLNSNACSVTTLAPGVLIKTSEPDLEREGKDHSVTAYYLFKCSENKEATYRLVVKYSFVKRGSKGWFAVGFTDMEQKPKSNRVVVSGNDSNNIDGPWLLTNFLSEHIFKCYVGHVNLSNSFNDPKKVYHKLPKSAEPLIELEVKFNPQKRLSVYSVNGKEIARFKNPNEGDPKEMMALFFQGYNINDSVEVKEVTLTMDTFPFDP